MDNEAFLLENHLKSLKLLAHYGGFSLDSKCRTLKTKLRDLSVYLLNFFWLNSDLVGGIYWFVDGLAKGNSLIALTYIAPCITYSFMANCKGFFLLKYEFEINEVIDSLKALELKNARGKDKEKRRIMEEETKFLGIVIKISNVINVLLVLTFATSSLILTVYKYMKTKKLDLILPFPIVYPFDSHDIRYWPFVYIHQIWSD
ncbi:uncharacterized protein [Epargyreus clarus]|uniref:uncharacterized protein n=1 Tax=Epargyreus clarus TaxID=520877 RepID=UPI003C2BFF7E